MGKKTKSKNLARAPASPGLNAYGPPAPIPPPPDGLTLRLGLTPETFLISIPGPMGREYEIKIDGDAVSLLEGILLRLSLARRAGERRNAAGPGPKAPWAKGQTLVFTPRASNSWQTLPWWPKGAVGPLPSCPITVESHRVNGTVLCLCPDGKVYGLPERFLSPPRAKPVAVGTNFLTFEDLGL